MSPSLPDLSAEYAVAPEQADALQRDGHVLLRGLAAPEEVAAYRQAIVDATQRFKTDTGPLSERDTYGKAFIQVTNLWRRDPTVAQFVTAQRFASVAAALLGVERVRLYHDQALFKEAGGGPTPWHQDAFYWPLAGPSITMWMPLVDVTEGMGGMSFGSGTHHRGNLGGPTISDSSQAYFQRRVDSGDITATLLQPMAAGDATFHTGWTVHCAKANQTGTRRDVMTIIWFADGTKVAELENEYQRGDLEAFIPGASPGDLARSPLNPLLG